MLCLALFMVKKMMTKMKTSMCNQMYNLMILTKWEWKGTKHDEKNMENLTTDMDPLHKAVIQTKQRRTPH